METKELFNSQGLRCTRQRLEVYEALAMSKRHPTAEELFRTVKTSQCVLSRATVYNTLETFCEHGLCRKLPSTEGGARYDADLSDHLHLTTISGDVHDVPSDLGIRLLKSLSAETIAEIEGRLGVSVKRVDIALHVDADF